MPFPDTFLLGVDSLIVGAAIAPIVSSADRVRLAAMFGIADGLGFLVGWLLSWRLPDVLTAISPSVALVLYGAYVLTVTATGRRMAGWPIWLLPWVLTLDNFAYGLGERSGWSSALSQGGEQALASGAMALLGLGLVPVLGLIPVLRGTRHRIGRITTGIGLVLSAGLLLLT